MSDPAAEDASTSAPPRAVRAVAPAKINLALEVTGRRPDGYNEIDTVMTTLTLADAVREVLAGAGARTDEILGIAAASMRFALVVLDEAGQPLLAIPNRDGRAVAESAEIRRRLGEPIHARTGLWPTPIMALPRLLWFARHRAESWQHARHVLEIGRAHV